MKSWRQSAPEFVIVFLVAILLRIYNLFSLPIFADEAIYIRWSQVMQAVSSLRFLPLSDGKQPLFMWVTIPFLKIFEDPLLAGRIVSVFCGIASLIGIMLLSFTLFRTRKAALLAGLFYATSPFAIFFDRMALVDSMLMMFIVWCLVLASLVVKTRRFDLAMLTGFSLGGAWLTKSPGMIFFALLPIAAFLKKSTSLKNFITDILSLVPFWIISWVIGLAIYNILRLGPEFHMIAIRNKDYVFSFSEMLQHPTHPLFIHLQESVEWYWVLLPGSILLSAIAATLLGYKKYWRELLVLLVWSLVPLVGVSSIAKVFTARYILFTIPPLIVIAAMLPTLLKLKERSYWLLVSLLILPAVVIDILLISNPQKAPLPRVERSGYLELWTAGTGIREIAEFIKNETNNTNQKIIVGTEGYFGTLPDGLQIYFNKNERVLVKGVGLPISSVDSSLIQAKKSGDLVYLVVNSSRITEKPENLGIKLVEEYPKAIQPNGLRESLLLFEVLPEAIKISEIKNAKNN